jgi:hypothetical protein
MIPIRIAAMVAQRRKKGMKQIAVRGMDFDDPCAGTFRAPGGCRK